MSPRDSTKHQHIANHPKSEHSNHPRLRQLPQGACRHLRGFRPFQCKNMRTTTFYIGCSSLGCFRYRLRLFTKLVYALSRPEAPANGYHRFPDELPKPKDPASAAKSPNPSSGFPDSPRHRGVPRINPNPSSNTEKLYSLKTHFNHPKTRSKKTNKPPNPAPSRAPCDRTLLEP